MKHLFVPYSLALLAKEKGIKFDRNFETYALKSKDAKRLNDSEMYAPLYQQLVDWFREKHYLVITPYTTSQNSWCFTIRGSISNSLKLKGKEPDSIKMAVTYREALTEALTEAFKLI